MRWKPFLLTSCLIVLVAGCENKAGPPPSLDKWCFTEEPMRFTHSETIDYLFANEPVLLEQITSYNERGADRCRWTP